MCDCECADSSRVVFFSVDMKMSEKENKKSVSMFHEADYSTFLALLKRIKLQNPIKAKRETAANLHSRRVCQRSRYPQRISLVRFARHYHQYSFPVGACDLLIKPQIESEREKHEPKEATKIFVGN